MTANALQAYQQTRIRTASQGKLIVMLYDEGLKQLRSAKDELDSTYPNLETAHNAIVKAQDIITELMVSLDFEKGGDIARNLFNLYIFFNQTLSEANISKQTSGIIQVCKLMIELRDAWKSIEGSAEFQDKDSASGINLAG